MVNNNSKQNKKKKPVNSVLTEKQKLFCREYAKTGNGKQSAIKAGYAPKNAHVTASKFLTKSNIQEEISRLNERAEKKSIMDAQEVMELYSAIARGEVKDQFGLDASLADRIKAMNELAKRTVDIENRLKGTPDNVVQIKVNWKRD